MRVVGLISGGKDSCYNLMQCVSEGHEIVALANLRPQEKDELDSYMYQTVGHHVLAFYSEAIGLPLYQGILSKKAVCQEAIYTTNEEDEVEHLFQLLQDIKTKIDIDGVASGAVLSNYQRVRVENVCERLGLQSIAYLWRREQRELLEEMISSQVDAVLVKVAAVGLNPRLHLGKSISEMFSHLCMLCDKYGVHICGEGGEYETMTLDCPLFTKRIVIDNAETIIDTDDPVAPVGFLHFNRMHLEDKGIDPHLTLSERLQRSGFVKREFKIKSYGLPNLKETNEIHCTVSKDVNDYTVDLNGVLEKRIGNYLVISGVKYIASDTQTLTIEEETKLAMENLKDYLHRHHSSTSKVILVYLYMNDMQDLSAVNRVYSQYFVSSVPARVCVQLDIADGVRMVIDCLAICDDENPTTTKIHRDVLHVQSISHFAPANIGPCSQAVKVDNSVYFSGSIGLIPASMAVVKEGAKEECTVSLQHLFTVQSVIQPDTNIDNLTYLICYVTSSHGLRFAEQMYQKLKERNRHLPFIGCVVSGLPRAASVQWHAGSHASPCIDRVGHSFEKDLPHFRIRITASANVDGLSFFTLAIAPQLGKEIVQQSLVISTITDEFLAAQSQISVPGYHVLCVRIFIDESSFSDGSQFKRALQHCWKTKLPTCPPCMFISTNGLHHNAIVSLLVQFLNDEG